MLHNRIHRLMKFSIKCRDRTWAIFCADTVFFHEDTFDNIYNTLRWLQFRNVPVKSFELSWLQVEYYYAWYHIVALVFDDALLTNKSQ